MNEDKIFLSKQLEIVRDIKKSLGNHTWKELDDLRTMNGKKSCHVDTLRKGAFLLNEYDEYGWINPNDNLDIPIEDMKSSVEYKSDGSVVSDKLIEICDNEDMTPDFLMKAHGLDCNRWKIVSYKNNYWHSQVKGGKKLVMYQSKIVVKPNDFIGFEETENFFKKMSDTYEIPIRHYTKENKNGLMLEVPIMDLHLGKFGIKENVGTDYNINIAKENFYKVIDDIIDEVSNRNIEKIIFPIGNDFFNIDTLQYTTTAGTPQQCDTPWQQLYLIGVEMLIKAITKLSDIAPVEVFCINGNHDFMLSFFATTYIEAWFKKDEKVNVSKDTSPRKYIQFGECLIGFTHGDKEKKNINGIMQIEAIEAWGKTKYHEFHLGHLHSEQVEERNGIIVRNISSITGTDQWHYNSGYVGAIKKCQSFLWDKKYGLKNIINSIIE